MKNEKINHNHTTTAVTSSFKTASTPTSHPTSISKEIIDSITINSTSSLSKLNSYSKGLKWTSYIGFFDYNPLFFKKALKFNILNNTSTGFITNFSTFNYDVTKEDNNLMENIEKNGENNFFTIQFIGYFYTKFITPNNNDNSSNNNNNNNNNNNGKKNWKFEINSDDETFVWIGDNATSNNDFTTKNNFIYNNYNTSTQSNTIKLKSNTFYPIRIIYSNGQRIYKLNFSFTRPDGVVLNSGDGHFFN
jgi:hypothetical protein